MRIENANLNADAIANLNDDVIIYTKKSDFNIAHTLDCGQCFRFSLNKDNSIATGIVSDKLIEISQDDEKVIFHNTSEKEFNSFWKAYFDLDTDYNNIKAAFSNDIPIKTAMEYAGGIKILSQPKFETLCSFIISQNNNIPRIKGCINKFCERFGKKITDGMYSFPLADDLKGITKNDLQGLSLGYRDEYIVDCVNKITVGEISLEEISKMDIEGARKILRTIKGIGPKVAECVLLFGFHKLDAFPIDTWIKKVLAYYYEEGFPKVDYAGVAQQYLFHYIRTCADAPKID